MHDWSRQHARVQSVPPSREREFRLPLFLPQRLALRLRHRGRHYMQRGLHLSLIHIYCRSRGGYREREIIRGGLAHANVEGSLGLLKTGRFDCQGVRTGLQKGEIVTTTGTGGGLERCAPRHVRCRDRSPWHDRAAGIGYRATKTARRCV